MSEGPQNASQSLLGLLAARDARDSMERAVCWVILGYHEDMPRETWIVRGPFEEAAAALEDAAQRDRDMQADGGRGFRFDVVPVLP